jgi:hypothetical protein
MRRWLVLILVLVGVSPVYAQVTPWTAWLYNANGTMTRISSDGDVIQEVTLPRRTHSLAFIESSSTICRLGSSRAT